MTPSAASPLIDALVEQHGFPRLTEDAYAAFAEGAGDRVLFLTGDPAKNLETNDVAVILPELVRAFAGRFAAAVVDRTLEDALRERFEVWPTPSLIFLRDGAFLGAIPKVRDWDDYRDRIETILDGRAVAAE